ncbi:MULTISPECIES: type IV secretion system protein [unclassified Kribbella]|uniref:type IV secretion system protein n=1 Tax=unclassified Kribbella TaxID=2644121 RepID=UPI00301A5CB3
MIVLGCSWAPWDWDDCVEKYLGQAIEAAFGPFFKLLFEAIQQVVVAAVEAVLKGVAFLWISIDTPDISNNGAVGFVQVHTNYILGTAATVAVIVGGIQMAVSHRGEPLREILKALLTMVVVSSAGTVFAATLIQASDEFASWIISRALGADDHAFGNKLAELMTDPLKDTGEALSFVLVIFVGILMVITAIMQLGLMIVRYGMLVLLVGILPLTASATNTEMGMMWFKRALAWLAGFILYKPVAALIYATAIKLMGSPAAPDGAPEGTPQLLKLVMGVTMMIIAVVSLPAILRFVSPRTS